MKRELNQLKLIAEKPSATKSQKQVVSAHKQTIADSKLFQRANLSVLSPTDKRDIAERLDLAGVEYPPVVQLDLVDYDCKPLFQTFQDEEPKREWAMTQLAQVLAMWRKRTQISSFKALSPRLCDSSASNNSNGAFFLTTVVVNNLCVYLDNGESQEALVMQFCNLALNHFQLPDDDEDDDEVIIDREQTIALHLLRRSLSVVQLLDGTSPPPATPALVFQDIERVVAGTVATKCDDIFAQVGRSLGQNTFWKQRLKKLHEVAKVCVNYYPGMTKVIKAVEHMKVEPSPEFATEMQEHAACVTYYTKVVGDENAKSLEVAVLKKTHKSCELLLKALEARSDAKLAPQSLIDCYIELCSHVEAACPFDEALLRDVAALKDKKKQLSCQNMRESVMSAMMSFKSDDTNVKQLHDVILSSGFKSMDKDKEFHDATKQSMEKLLRAPGEIISARSADAIAVLECLSHGMISTQKARAECASKHLSAAIDVIGAIDEVLKLGCDPTFRDIFDHKARDEKIAAVLRSQHKLKLCKLPTKDDKIINSVCKACQDAVDSHKAKFAEVCSAISNFMKEAATDSLDAVSRILEGKSATKWLRDVDGLNEADEFQELAKVCVHHMDLEHLNHAVQTASEAHLAKAVVVIVVVALVLVLGLVLPLLLPPRLINTHFFLCILLPLPPLPLPL